LKARQRIEDPCIGGSIPPRATKNIVHATPTITGWRFCLWIHNPCAKLAGETSERHAIFSSIYLSIRLLRLLRPVLPAVCANPLGHTLLLAQFSARQTKLSPDTVSDECAAVWRPGAQLILSALADQRTNATVGMWHAGQGSHPQRSSSPQPVVQGC